jgi:hypothetical protein
MSSLLALFVRLDRETPLVNLFMANLSRNHIEKQVFNIGDLSPM